MRAFVSANVGLALVLASAAQAAPQAERTAKEPALCTVSGQVITAAEGSPIRSSRVILLDQNESSHKHSQPIPTVPVTSKSRRSLPAATFFQLPTRATSPSSIRLKE